LKIPLKYNLQKSKKLLSKDQKQREKTDREIFPNSNMMSLSFERRAKSYVLCREHV